MDTSKWKKLLESPTALLSTVGVLAVTIAIMLGQGEKVEQLNNALPEAQKTVENIKNTFPGETT